MRIVIHLVEVFSQELFSLDLFAQGLVRKVVLKNAVAWGFKLTSNFETE